MSGLIILGYLCLLLSFIFGIIGMSIDPKKPKQLANPSDDQSRESHMNLFMENTTFSLFAQTLALMGLAFLYAGKN